MRITAFIPVLFVLAPLSFGTAIQIPAGSLSVSGVTSGAPFTYTGTLTQNDTLQLIVSGTPCLQNPPSYCTNGAGVVVTAGSSPVGAQTSFSGSFNGTSSTWTYGSLLLEISGVGTVQLFQPNAANGLGSGAPPTSLTLTSSTLSGLGFGNFSVVNPTLTFVLADTLYSDNSGSFTLSQSSSTPEPSSFALVTLACGIGGLLLRRRR